MNKYNHWLAKLFHFLFGRNYQNYAITIGQTSYFSCETCLVSLSMRKHEDCHKRQFAKDGKLKFLSHYIYQWIKIGYDKIDYEIEAVAASKV